ncbi:MAG: type I-C CRISPR-associated protein Cas8c/Csd1 [Clostridium sp.]|nr:type I-C CRISPR-associated protein Cas8c/Csd1 [Clostridium sp.]
MSMMDLLYRTYEYAYKANDTQLMEHYLISQTTAAAPIELWISEEGEFADAGYISDKTRQKISIPCTEKSAGRSGTNPYPHPLFDKLIYLAGDGAAYQLDNQKAHCAYMEQLRAWRQSEWGSDCVKTVYSYLEKNTLLHDLERKGILDASEPAELKKRCNEFVRIGIRRDFQADRELWKETCIQEDFVRWLRSAQGEGGLCYISGEEGALSENHPKAIWNIHANAKLISANEKENRGLVFSGRFETSGQAVQVSYEASQKIHNALKWLIQKQGKPIGDKMLVAWGTGPQENADLKTVFDGTADLFDDEDEEIINADTQAEFAERLKAAVFRREQDLRHNERIGFLVLEAATPGRLSVSYYQEFYPVQYSELVQNVGRWHADHAWDYSVFDSDQKIWVRRIQSPSVFEIARFAEGTEKNGKIEVDKDRKIEGNAILRLLPCVTERRAIPGDIARKLVQKSFYPLCYSKKNWSKLLKITCSVIRVNFKEVGTMDINRDTIDIHYNYGRWLACAHEMERRALQSAGEDRATNAMRLFTKFAENPNKYMGVIQQKILVYETKLGQKALWLKNEKYAISANLQKNPLEALAGARHLDGRMILGFEAQMESFKNKSENRRQSGGEKYVYTEE